MREISIYIITRIVIALGLTTFISVFLFAIDLYVNHFVREIDLSFENQLKRSGLFFLAAVMAIIMNDTVDYISKKTDKK